MSLMDNHSGKLTIALLFTGLVTAVAGSEWAMRMTPSVDSLDTADARAFKALYCENNEGRHLLMPEYPGLESLTRGTEYEGQSLTINCSVG